MCILGMLGAGAVAAQEVPSGQPVTLFDAISDEVNNESWLRLRFLAPEITRGAGTVTFEQAGEDMAYLCAKFGLAYAQKFNLSPQTIVISLSDRETEFGVQDQDATQFFDAFRVVDDACIWEAF